MKRVRQQNDQSVLSSDPQTTGKYDLHTVGHAEVPQDRKTQKIKPVGDDLQDMFGKACRDCINFDFGLKLTRDDCKYNRNPDGHRTMETCAYCGRTRPIVQGLKFSGRLKLRFG